MLSSPRRRVGLWLAAVGAAAVLGYFALREGPRSTASAAQPATAPTAEEEVAERPATPRPRPAPSASPIPPRAPPPPSPEQAAIEEEEPAPSLSPAEAPNPAVLAVLAARDDRTPAGTRSLITSLTSEDEIVVAEATKALIERGATEAIGPLARIDLTSAAGSGLSIIDALGRLGAVATDSDRGVAVDRLIEMLAEEKRRGARGGPRHLPQIYEALGKTGDPRAAAPLEAELLDPTVPRAPKVVIVGSLVQLAQPSSRAALETALETESAAVGSDAFEEEIRVELVGVIAAALKVL